MKITSSFGQEVQRVKVLLGVARPAEGINGNAPVYHHLKTENKPRAVVPTLHENTRPITQCNKVFVFTSSTIMNGYLRKGNPTTS